MTTIQIDELNPKDYTDSREIYSLEIKKEKKTPWLWINYSEGYNLNKWTVKEAVDYWLSEEARIDRYISNCRAWGYYD